MLGRWSKGKTARIALWTLAYTIGAVDVLMTHNWWRAGLYALGTAMCLTMNHRFAQTIGTASVKAYLKGREHHARDQEGAQVVSIGRRR